MAMRQRGGGVGPNRPYRPPRAAARPVYEDFRPVFERHQEEEAEKLLIYLPGFMKENIKVSTEGKNTVRVRGERLVAGNKWNRFQEDFQAPDDCNMRGIHAKFENGILTIIMPWKIPKQFDEPIKQTPLTTPPPPPPQKDDLPTKQTLTTPPPPQKDDFPPKTPRKPTPLKPTAQLPKPQIDDKDQDLTGVKEKQRDEKKILQGQLGAVESSNTQKGSENLGFRPLKATQLDKTSAEKEKSKDEKEVSKGQMGNLVKSSKTQKGNETYGLPPFIAAPLGKTSAEKEKSGDEKKILEGVVGSIEPKIQKSKEEKLDKNSTELDKRREEVEKKRRHEEVEEEGRKDAKKSKGLKTEYQEKVEHIGSKEKGSVSNLAAGTSSHPGGEFSIGNLKKSLFELNEERQLLVNAGAAVLVIMALGAYVYHSIGSGRAE